ncbi:Sensory box histidine kinase [hydrothermal vent metagenome]|uniref:histidine kinase n=1 Tax=hydrothermal vent metagenome TaxID=652676 RepID=A0A3B0YS92_9ZZZZ
MSSDQIVGTQASDALRKRWGRILENSFDEIYLFAADNLHFLNVSRGALHNLGYTMQEMQQLTATDIKPEVDAAEFATLLEPLRDGQQERVVFETVHERKDGSCYPVEVRLQLATEESPPVFIAIILDITERRQAERIRLESERRYHALTRIAPVGIFRTDVAGNCIYTNERWCQIAGMDSEQALGEGWSMALHPEDRQRVIDEWYLATKTHVPFYTECRFQRPDGTVSWLLVRATAEPGVQGSVIGYVGTITDISRQKKIEDELRIHRSHLEELVSERTHAMEVANRELEAFAYSVSHDLRAPLRAIDGFSHALEEDCADTIGDLGRDHLRRVRAASQRMGRLIDDILQLSRMARGDMQWADVDMSKLACTVIDRLREAEPERDVDVRVMPGIQTRGDKALLGVLLDNLIGNAWKYTSKKEHAFIEMGVLEQDDALVYFIKDNGAGFNMRYSNKLFGIFQRLHKADEFEGTGIGLATVERIIHRHNGRVWAESEVDKGATFFFTFDRPGLPAVISSSHVPVS